jgi:glycosyltransferase involved in cell wall biosynthesis
MTDPRFYGWLWEMEDEIRPLMPMIYYHVWDNYPYPNYNRNYYLSNDKIVAISKVTDDILKKVAPEVDSEYLPHAVESGVFLKYDSGTIKELRRNNFDWNAEQEREKFVVFWNNRNARRKQPATVMWWFKEFLEKVGQDKAVLVMHTDPHDINGPNLEAVLHELDLADGEIQFSTQKIDPPAMAVMYNMADVVVNIADAEGFGLSTLEALSCETPIIVNMTGGLQEQVTDGKDWFGIGIEPNSKEIVGSQQVPFIYEDRIGKKDFLNALEKIYNMSREERKELGAKGHGHVEKNYSFENYQKRWLEIITNVYEKHGSWATRKNYNSWTLDEVA